MNIATVYTELVAAINNATLSGNTLQVVATVEIPDAPEPPHFYPFTYDMAYDKDFGGGGELTIVAHLLLSRADSETGQQEAQTLAGTGADTIRATINAARRPSALNGACSDLQLRRAAGPRDFAFPDGTHFWGVEFTIFVID